MRDMPSGIDLQGSVLWDAGGFNDGSAGAEGGTSALVAKYTTRRMGPYPS